MVNICSLTSIHADGPVVADEFLICVDHVDYMILVMVLPVSRLQGLLSI